MRASWSAVTSDGRRKATDSSLHAKKKGSVRKSSVKFPEVQFRGGLTVVPILSLHCPLKPTNAYRSSTSVAETLRAHAHKYAELNAHNTHHITNAQSHAASHVPAFQQFATMANLPEAQAKGGLTVVPHKYKESCSRSTIVLTAAARGGLARVFSEQSHCPGR